MKRILATTLVAMAAFATPAAAFAAPPTAPSGPTLTIDGKTYGPKDGLEITTVTVSAGRTTATTTSARGTEVTPMATGDRFQVNHGTSYVSSYEQSLVEYVGKSYAAGNVAESKRWIQACFRYNRNGRDLVGNICSTASSASGTWRPGVVNQKTVFDSLGLNDPQTKFTYTFASVNPGVS